MKHFHKIFCLLLAAALLLLTLSACGSSGGGDDTDSKTVVVATSPDYPPFEDMDGEKIVGIEPELVELIAQKLGITVQWESVDYNSIITGVEAGRYDVGAAAISITPERQENCDFTQPYFLAAQTIVVLPGSDIQGKDDLAGKTIAVQTGTTAESYCMENGYTVLSFDSSNDAAAALSAGKADAWVVDNEVAVTVSQKLGLVMLDEAMTSEPFAFAFAKGSELTAQFDAALAELLADGSVQKLFDKYDALYVAP